MKKILLISLLLSLSLFANVATITAVKGEVTVKNSSNETKATLGHKLIQKDRIITKKNSKAQIIFKDETTVSIGKNSDFSIEEYLFEEGQEPVAKFSMLKGAMRTITGKIGKIAPHKFSVKTKTATIGIRGTNFTVIVADDGSFSAYCTYGAIGVTINGKLYVIKQGYYLKVSATGKVKISSFTPAELKQMRMDNFDLVRTQDSKLSKNNYSIDTENGEQLNITLTDESGLIMQDAEDLMADNIQNLENSQSLSELLASYTMNNASYDGTIIVTATGGAGLGLVSGQDATLSIDFGADALELKLNDSITFNKNPVFSDNGFTVDEAPFNIGNATGTFSEPTGNSVSGNFLADDGGGYSHTGTYSVSTSQTLH